MKKILFVGSMYDQKISVLKEAKKMGLFVALMGNDYPSWGSKYIDLYIKSNNYDTFEALEILDNLNLKFDGVVTFWDRDVELTSKIAAHFDLPGCPIKAATIMRNKYLTRKVITKYKIPNIPYKLMTDLSTLNSAIKEIGYPAVIKPVSASSSKGIFKISSEKDIDEVREKIIKTITPEKDKMFLYNKGKFIFEQFITGQEYSVESVIQNGNINIIGITEKITNNQFEEVQHTHPAPIDKNNEKQIKETVKKVLKAIGADNCTTHTEIKLTKEGPRIVEVNGRMGGDYINTDLVPLARGINIVRATLQVSLNESIRDAVSPKFNKGASVRFIIPSHAGTIKSWKIDKELFEKKEFVKIHKDKKVGEKILFPPNAFHDTRAGYLIAKNSTAEKAKKNAQEFVDKYVRIDMYD